MLKSFPSRELSEFSGTWKQICSSLSRYQRISLTHEEGFLSTTSSISDPLGIISPVLSAKKLIQDLCKQGLHHFADASEIAYGAVSNIRFVNEEWNAVHCSFLVGKSRLGYVKPMTIPRLELSAAVVAVKLDRTLKEELEIKIDRSVLWSDSTAVLQYIKNEDKQFHTFVAIDWQ